jgi:hypothetical protein
VKIRFAGGFAAVGVVVFDRVKREYLNSMRMIGAEGRDICHLIPVICHLFRRVSSCETRCLQARARREVAAVI